MPAQKAAASPTGPAPMIVMSRISSKSAASALAILGHVIGVVMSGSMPDVSASPSSAPSARSTEAEMQVNIGVSRSV